MNLTLTSRRLLALALFCGVSCPSFVSAAGSEQVLDIPAFRKVVEKRHEASAKKDPSLRPDLKRLEKIVKAVPDFPGPWALLARREGRSGNARRAEEDFKTALSFGGNWSGAAIWNAEFLMERNRDREAETLLRSALALRPGDALLERRLADCAFSGDLSEASRLWQGVYKKNGMATDALLASARADFSRKDFGACRKKLESLLKIHPSNREILEWRVRAAEADGAAGDAAKARETLAARGRDCDDLAEWVEGLTEGKPERALSLYSQAVSRYVGCATLWKRLGLALENAGRGPEALDAYRRACRLTGVPDAFLASRVLELGGTRECEPPSKDRRSRPIAWKGDALKTLADLENRDFKSERDFPVDLLLRAAADRDGASATRAWVARWRNRFPVAVALVEAAAWRTERQPGRALETLSAAADARPLDPRPYLPWCETLLESKDPVQGLETCVRWAEVDTGKGPLLWKARFLIDAGRPMEAGDLLREVLARDPENALAWKELVRVHDLAQDKPSASEACRVWAQWKPLDREAWETWFKHLGTGSPEGTMIQRILKLLPM